MSRARTNFEYLESAARTITWHTDRQERKNGEGGGGEKHIHKACSANDDKKSFNLNRRKKDHIKKKSVQFEYRITAFK